MAKTVDDLGLVNNDQHFVTVFPGDTPQTAKALVYRVVYRHNQDRETINYGALPTTTSDTLATYAGSTATPTANGLMPANSYSTSYYQFPRTALSSTLNVKDNNDIWYLDVDYYERIFHIHAYFWPGHLRVGLEIPPGTKQERFQRERVIGGVGSALGWKRGSQELMLIPELHAGWMFGNDWNAQVYTGARFVYGEYVVKIPSEPEAIWSILSHQEDAYWLKLPIAQADATVNQAMQKDYGFTGFTIYPKYRKTDAIADYTKAINAIKTYRPIMLG